MRLIWMIILACWLPIAVAESWTLYLVRHAEKAEGPDPQLTADGHQRAARLADLLGSAGLERVWTSDYRRTRQTAAPLMERRTLPLAVYDPRDLARFADELRHARQSALVVGHSNTTPELVRHLGGEAQDMEEWQYDRVYQLRMGADGQVETRLLHLPPLSQRPGAVTTDMKKPAMPEQTPHHQQNGY